MGRLLADWDDLYRNEQLDLLSNVIGYIQFKFDCEVPTSAYDGLFELTSLAYKYLQNKCESNGRSTHYHYEDLDSASQMKISQILGEMVIGVLESEEDDDGDVDWGAIIRGGFRMVKVASYFMGGLGLLGGLIDSIGDFT